MGDLYGIETYLLYPPAGPFWWPNRDEPELFERYEDAVYRAYELMYQEDLKRFSFQAAVFEAKDQV